MLPPVIQELLIGWLSGLVIGPLGLVLWPLSTWAAERLLRGLGQDSFLALLLHFLWDVLTCLVWLALPMLGVPWALAHWGMQGMEVHFVGVGYRTVSAAGFVFIAGLLAGLWLALCLSRVPIIRRAVERSKAWLERRLGLNVQSL